MNKLYKPEDLEFQIKHNLNQDELEFYTERMGFRVEDGDMTETAARTLTLVEIREKRNGRK